MFQLTSYKHIIWDWNGTLLNDGWLFVDVMNSILIKRKMNPITLEKYRNIFGFPVKNYYIKLGFDFKKEPFKNCSSEFINEYKKRIYEAKLYSDAIPLLTELKQNGIEHYILSAQHQTLLNKQIKYYKIQNYFNKIIGLDNHYANSKINIGIKWINNIHLDSNKILMIGDTYHDFEVAKSMGIDCILLSHGHCCHSRLIKTGLKVFHHLNEIK